MNVEIMQICWCDDQAVNYCTSTNQKCEKEDVYVLLTFQFADYLAHFIILFGGHSFIDYNFQWKLLTNLHFLVLMIVFFASLLDSV